MRFVAFLLFFSLQFAYASNPDPIPSSPSDSPLLTKGMREVAFDVNLTTCPVDTPEGGVLRIRGGKTLNDVLGGFPVGSKPAFEDLKPMPYENLFCLLLTGSETSVATVNEGIFAGIERAKTYLRSLTRQEERIPIRFLENVLKDCLADEFDGRDPKQQLQELATSGPQIIGVAITVAAYLNHFEMGGNLETFKIVETLDSVVKNFMKMALPADRLVDERIHIILSTYFDLLIGHGMNLSTSILIQTASGGGDLANTISAALNALDTDNHGKAALKVHEMLKDASGTYGGEAPRFIDAVVAKDETFWGHGHAIYKKGTDPRAEIMEVLVRKIREITTDIDLQHDIDLALVIKAEAEARELPWQTNVDYFASLVLRGCGVRPELSTVMFATSRIGSWIADLYQYGQSKTALMRPKDKPAERNPLLAIEDDGGDA